MALTKETIEDKIEIVGEYKNIQVRTATVIKEDGVEINRSFHRRTLDCISSEKNEDNSWTHTDTDVSRREFRGTRHSNSSLDNNS